MTKKALRKEILNRRDRMDLTLRRTKSALIQQRLSQLPEFREAECVLLFASYGSEVDTSGIIKLALSSKKRVVLPKVDAENRTLLLYRINDINELRPGFRGIPEPLSQTQQQILPDEVEFILLPGVAFDSTGGRMGYGGGYYDRLIGGLKKKPHLVAIAFEEQIVDQVPMQEYDMRVDIIITDSRTIHCRKV